MSDDTPDTPSTPPDDDRQRQLGRPVPEEPSASESDQWRRDERIAALLEVEPLDEVTRRRLVRTAVASAPPRRPRLALVAPVAAAIVIGLVVGAILVSRPDDPTTTAAPATSADAPEPRAAGAPALETTGSPPALGDLGDVSDAAALRRALASARASKEAADAETSEKAAPTSGGCATTPPPEAGAVVATATGTFGGTPVVIVVGTDSTGAEIAFVLRAGDCTVLEQVPVAEG